MPRHDHMQTVGTTNDDVRAKLRKSGRYHAPVAQQPAEQGGAEIARLPLQAARAKFVNRVEGWRLTTVVQTHAQHLVPAQCELEG